MKKLIPVYVRIPVIFFTVFGALEYFIDSGDRPAFIKFPIVSIFLFVFFFLLVAIEITISAVDNVTYHLLTDEQKKQLEEATDTNAALAEAWRKVMKVLTRSRPISEESELLLNHDYDGIQELDNRLPPWWLYLFYLTIIGGAVYLVRFHVIGTDEPELELRKEIAEAKMAIEAYKKTAPDQMTEEKVTLLTDATSLAAGKAIFTANCVACHRADAGGQIGPNLTDEYWLLGGGIKNVFHTVTNGGRDGKGMIAWKATLKPTQIQQVASYVLSLQGSKPQNPKAPDGEIWKDDAKAAKPADSTAVAAAVVKP
ncbi:cbb3-type cytochrome c oxidase N-terminal domain-containing protein [Flavobacterium sp. HJ-32-4]|uniref:cbb3-type cytochrome c oxidase N-terminal domain-containing protein n=2 Tax=unclassified Flavobacterium TaxID=196869 RepID=UPI001F148DDF|nr:cbb3-type cytochrome c oxidase N-terminal domain-containing protein [Flavobacterium sp. HJ-32-4]UMY64472.1 c-type cytochrome [Flavobacterium sp. HJ-32-4]